MDKKAIVLGLILTGCTHYDIDQTRYGKYPLSQRTPWTPPDPCYTETFERSSDEHLRFKEPLSLAFLLDYSLCHNPLTQKSWSLAKGSYYAFMASKGSLYPLITGNISETFEINSASSNINELEANSNLEGSSSLFFNNSKLVAFSQSLSLNWLLLDFGGRCASIEMAKYALLQANWTHNQTLQDVLFRVIYTYYQALAALAQKEAQEQNLLDAQESLKAAEVQFEAGVVTKLDYLQAKSNLMQAEYNLVQAAGNLEIAMANLAESAGLPPDTSFHIVEVGKIEPVEVTQSVEKLIEVARSERGDLSALFASYKQSKAAERFAFSNFFPQVVASGDLSQTQFSAGFGSIKNASAVIGVQWTLFNGFQNQYDFYQSKMNIKAAYSSWKDLEQQVCLQVVTSYNQFITANQNLSNSAEYYEYSAQAFKAALLGYRAGTTTILDVLNTESNLAQARSAVIQSRTNWLTALGNISYSTGMLYEGGYVPCSDCY